MVTVTNQGVYLTKIPMPPTSNQMYAPVGKGGRFVPMKQFKQFKKDIEVYEVRNYAGLLKAQERCQGWVKDGYVIKVSIQFNFKKGRLFAKSGNPKKLDASNRLKAGHDAISDMIGVDDCYFFSEHHRKVENGNSEEETYDVVVERVMKEKFLYLV